MKKLLKISLPVFAAVLFLNAFTVTSANAQGILQEILKRMDAQNKTLASLRARVTMVKENVQLGDSETTIGTALYLPQKGKDALVRIDWTKPDESLAVVNRQYVIYRPRLGQAYVGTVDKAKGNAKANGALAFMNMSRAQLKANYEVAYLGEATVSSGEKTWHLQLTPKMPTSYKLAEIWVNPDGFPVQTKVTELNNDSTTVLLTNLEKNITLNGGLFKINLPSGTRVIKG